MAAPGMISKSVPLVVAASLLLSCRDAPTNPNDDPKFEWVPTSASFFGEVRVN